MKNRHLTKICTIIIHKCLLVLRRLLLVLFCHKIVRLFFLEYSLYLCHVGRMKRHNFASPPILLFVDLQRTLSIYFVTSVRATYLLSPLCDPLFYAIIPDNIKIFARLPPAQSTHYKSNVFVRYILLQNLLTFIVLGS